MAETVNVPGLGAVNRDWVIIGVAVPGAYLAWRWWQSRSAAAAAPAPQLVDPNNPGEDPTVGATDQNAPTSTDSTVSVDETAPGTITTNADWTKAAVDYLSQIGFESTTVATALGAYLDRQPLTGDQQTIVRTAIGAIGPAPVGGPYPILSSLGNQPPPPTSTPTAGATYRVTTKLNLSELIHTVYKTPYTDTTEFAILAEQILALNPDHNWGPNIPIGTVVNLPSAPHTIQ
jgi:cytoskeletal protein RodZ